MGRPSGLGVSLSQGMRWVFGFGVSGSGLRAYGLEFWVRGFGAQSFKLRVCLNAKKNYPPTFQGLFQEIRIRNPKRVGSSGLGRL